MNSFLVANLVINVQIPIINAVKISNKLDENKKVAKPLCLGGAVHA